MREGLGRFSRQKRAMCETIIKDPGSFILRGSGNKCFEHYLLMLAVC